MSYTHNTCFVSQITTGAGGVYYFCSSTRLDGMTLDGNAYSPFILSVGNGEKVGNFGEGFSIGKCSMVLLLGQKQYQDDFNLDISIPWNNSACVIKIRDIDSDVTWSDCEDYYSGVIKDFNIGNDTVSFDIEDIDSRDNKILPLKTVDDVVAEDANLDATDIPEDSRGKRVPIQMGELNNASIGFFAKGLLVSNKIGFQEIRFDTENLLSLSSIGMWDPGLKRYFTGKAEGEYTIDPTTFKFVEFRVDSLTTLAEDIAATTGAEGFTVADYTKLVWTDESDYPDIDSYPEILSVNIIRIDSELMLLIEQPASGTIYVERAYGGTDAAIHLTGAPIFQSAKFSARNLLSFSETFKPKALSNFYQRPALSDFNPFVSGVWNDVLESNLSSYLRIGSYAGDDGFNTGTFINFDMRFEKIEDQFTCYGAYLLIKIYFDYLNAADRTDVTLMSTNSLPSSLCPTTMTGNETHQKIIDMNMPINTRRQFTVDNLTVPSRENITTADYIFTPDIRAELNFYELTELNKKWKCNLRLDSTSALPNYANYVFLYGVGFLIDFFAPFTDRRIVAPGQGRLVTATVDTILDNAKIGQVAILPWQNLILLLIEIGYTPSDFDIASWRDVDDYYGAWETAPTMAMSYGIDEHEKGWELCQSIASQFMLTLTKTDAGKIKIINLKKLQDTSEVTGYKSMIAYAISIDDIPITGGNKAISLQQTGTDRIRNSVKIKYNRNNSTDEYQNTFPGGEQGFTSDGLDTDHILPESGLTLSGARSTYYGGNKTEDLVIEAFALWGYTGAYDLWRWHINDKAEVCFYATITLPHYHYSDVNSKTSQYDIGDVVYLDGKYQGITFNSSHKWVIRNIKKVDNGKEIIIEIKSIQPVSEF